MILGDYRDINLRKGWAKSIAIATRQKSHGEMEFHLPGNGIHLHSGPNCAKPLGLGHQDLRQRKTPFREGFG